MRLVVLLAVVASVSAASRWPATTTAAHPAAQRGRPAARAFEGTITDSECDDASHAAMRMGDTDAECVLACVDAHGARFLLRDTAARITYELTDQKAPAAFAGRKAIVTGTLDAATRTIAVESIAATP